ncbi:hypothetical protein [Methylococcus sp. EFPC2]|uniref:hypothetical protein n=1 Tax=Methylococcus sp. EFPC2 TaxID=2812648 RepID=UPI001967D6DC|nr:hypothetical protein [Methylococcus sp. EFPC2]QSA97722.1 hypothetical protein JWZ97_02490 [Methylococcus sp. EFPC2]
MNGGYWAKRHESVRRKCRALRWASTLVAGLLLWAGHSPLAGADWSGFSQYQAVAEARLVPGRLSVNLKIKSVAMPDLARRTGVASDDAGMIAARLLRFQDGSGKLPNGTPAAVRRVDPDSAGSAAEAYVEAELEFALDGEPAELTIKPADGLADKTLGLVFLHRGIPVGDLFPLNKPVKLDVNHADPWRSRFDDPELVRRHAEPRTYVYLEAYEVRQESVLRLSDLEPYLNLGLKDARFVEPTELDGVKEKIGAFMAAKHALTIDGRNLPGQLDRVEFLAYGAAGLRPVDDAGRLETATAVLGVIQVYLTERPAQTLSVDWDLFPDGSDKRAVSVLHGRETFDGYVTRQQPRYTWSRDEAFEPVADSAGDDAASAGLQPSVVLNITDEARLKDMLRPLLHNAYRAFQLRDEEAVYDRLAKSLDGPLLEDTYLQHRRALLQRAKGLGGVGRVERVTITEAHALAFPNRSDPEVRVRWIAHGVVAHWGHSHPRDNYYEARLRIHGDEEGAWKIVALHFVDGQDMQSLASR